ncbi:MAG: FGGY-family carbohydrate kinase [Fimbriiglobus sp.]|nr:FGGY-family carbohydrate kinase [Fimbriiglobus sp.]
MSEPLRCVPESAVIVGWDFSTGSVKALAFDTSGKTLAEVRFPTELFTDGGVSELSFLQLEGQARATTRQLFRRLVEIDRMFDWVAGGISATHHTAGWLDDDAAQVRRMICWNDQTLAKYHAEGLARLGGQTRAIDLTGGPWAVRYGLSHLVKDEHTLSRGRWERAAVFAPHGLAAAGFLTGNFHQISASCAASSGMLDLRTNQWRREMLDALADPAHRDTVWECLPEVIDMSVPLGPLAEYVALDTGMTDTMERPLIFPTLDDQAAGLIGGGAVDPGQIAVILGNSAVVNSSSDKLPGSGSLDCMKLNWGPYLWMRCYSNGAQFLDRVVGPNPDWPALEAAARAAEPRCDGAAVLPFVLSEPSVGVNAPRFEWVGGEPGDMGVKVRASFEAISYLIALAVKEHEAAGQVVTRVTVSGGIAQSELMCEILASVLNKPLERLESNEGPALGAAVAALAGLETYRRCEQGIKEPFTAADAVQHMVRFRGRTVPNAEWVGTYQNGLAEFKQRIA